MTAVHVYAPAPVMAYLRRLDCPTCAKSRFALCLSYEYFGPEMTCLGCGERWDEEGRCDRPFERAWRKRTVSQAREQARRYKAKLAAPVRWRT